MSKKIEFLRKKVLKYSKSGKNVIVAEAIRGGGSHLLDLDGNFQHIGTRSLRGLPKNSALDYTKYTADLQKSIEGEYVYYKVLRIIHNDDLDLEKWKPDKQLENLNILESLHITEEEKYWAGKKEGNLGLIFTLIFFLCLCSIAMYQTYLEESWFGFGLLSIVGFFLLRGVIKTKIIFPKKPLQTKINRLVEYKNSLLENTTSQNKEFLSTLEKKLKKFSYWESLDPQSFEVALKVYLKDKGYELEVSQYSGDGGIDLQGINKFNQRVIIQAKKYSKAVGVSVVRELLGVKNSKEEKVQAIVYSLNGFTRGAIKFAEENDIKLESIRNDLIN